MPQIGAVLVPLNYRLIADDFAYLINHSGARIVCAHSDYLDAVESIRAQLPGVSAFVALEGDKPGWLDYETLLAEAPSHFHRPAIARNRPAHDQLHQRHHFAAEGRDDHASQRLPQRRRHAPPPSDDHGGSLSLDAADVSRQRLDFCLDCHGRGRDAHLPAQGRAECGFRKDRSGIGDDALRRADGLDQHRPRALRNSAAPRAADVRVLTAGAPPAAATIERVEGELGWVITQAYGLTETSPLITFCEPRPEHEGLSRAERSVIKARQGVELLTSGELRVVDEEGRDVPHDGATIGEIIVRGNVVMKGYYADPEATAEAMRDGWFHSGDAAVIHPDGYAEIRDRIKDVIISGGENISSVEVEGVLLRHPAVQEVAIVGLPNERWGEAPHAFVVLKAGAAATEAELRDFARAHLAHFKAPQGITFLVRAPENRHRQGPEVSPSRKTGDLEAVMDRTRSLGHTLPHAFHPEPA